MTDLLVCQGWYVSADCRSFGLHLLSGSAFFPRYLQVLQSFSDLPARGHTSDLHFSLLPCEACIVKQSSCGSRGIKAHIRSAILPIFLNALAFQQISRHQIPIRICFTTLQHETGPGTAGSARRTLQHEAGPGAASAARRTARCCQAVFFPGLLT